MRFPLVVLLALVLSAGDNASAQTAVRLGMTTGWRSEHTNDGQGVALVLSTERNKWTFTVRAPDLLSVKVGEDTISSGTGGGSRYYWDYFANGQRRCRDRQTGQFARNSLCSSSGGGTRVDDILQDYTGAAVEAAYEVGRYWRVGVGTKWQDRMMPYGLFGVSSLGSKHRFSASVFSGYGISGMDFGYSYRVW